jgi:hypothetical protein
MPGCRLDNRGSIRRQGQEFFLNHVHTFFGADAASCLMGVMVWAGLNYLMSGSSRVP